MTISVLSRGLPCIGGALIVLASLVAGLPFGAAAQGTIGGLGGGGGVVGLGGDYERPDPAPAVDEARVVGRWKFDLATGDEPHRLDQEPLAVTRVGDYWVATDSEVLALFDIESGARVGAHRMERGCVVAELRVHGSQVDVVCGPTGHWRARLDSASLSFTDAPASEGPIEISAMRFASFGMERRYALPDDPVVAAAPNGAVASGLKSLFVISAGGAVEHFDLSEQARYRISPPMSAMGMGLGSGSGADSGNSPPPWDPDDYHLAGLAMTQAVWSGDSTLLATAWELEIKGPKERPEIHSWIGLLDPDERRLAGVSLKGRSPLALTLSRDGQTVAWVTSGGRTTVATLPERVAPHKEVAATPVEPLPSATPTPAEDPSSSTESGVRGPMSSSGPGRVGDDHLMVDKIAANAEKDGIKKAIGVDAMAANSASGLLGALGSQELGSSGLNVDDWGGFVEAGHPFGFGDSRAAVGGSAQRANLKQEWTPTYPESWYRQSDKSVLAMSPDGQHIALANASDVAVWKVGVDEPLWVGDLGGEPVTDAQFVGAHLRVQQKGGSLIELRWE